MRSRVQSLLRNPRVQGAGDTLLAAFLAVTSVVPVLGGNLSWGKPKTLGVALALLSTVPIAWRARRPLTAAAIILAANGACIYAAAPQQAAFQPFVALVLVAYSVGSRAEGRRALWVPPVLAVAVIPIFVAAVAHGQSAGNAIPSFVWLLAAWVVGRNIRNWREKNTALQALERANRELAEQRELQAQAAVAVERGRIARELHDVVAHNVSMIVVQAGAAAHVLHGEQPDVRNALDVIAATGRETVDEMRALLGVLRSDGPDALKPQPGLGDLEQLVCGVREAGLPVTLRIEGSRRPLPPALDLSAFRIVQEALTNTLKHAGPARAQVMVRYEDGLVTLEIADDGGGPRSESGTGHGLVGMRERAAMFGGELEATPATGGGFTVRARLPLTTSTPA
jgi:signal transduction histidine kinase